MVLDNQALDTRHLPNKANSSKGIPINVDDSTSVVDKRICFENTNTKDKSKEQKASGEPPSGPAEEERRRAIDWDSLRKEALLNSEKKERSKDATDSLDYEALRRAHVNEISDAIRECGMNNLVADRIKDLLNRLVRDHGAIAPLTDCWYSAILWTYTVYIILRRNWLLSAFTHLKRYAYNCEIKEKTLHGMSSVHHCKLVMKKTKPEPPTADPERRSLFMQAEWIVFKGLEENMTLGF
ncbi:DNA glycosylase [Artemisia annua]|uniref:DNA glycosylase n=1 Tax=Artemisia annua TaxID=35608 RepID=A0A2U1PUG4_ARTAN|nr:DNA glycosylase [Artemisia annua]